MTFKELEEKQEFRRLSPNVERRQSDSTGIQHTVSSLVFTLNYCCDSGRVYLDQLSLLSYVKQAGSNRNILAEKIIYVKNYIGVENYLLFLPTI